MYLGSDLSAKGLKGSGYYYAWKGKQGIGDARYKQWKNMKQKGGFITQKLELDFFGGSGVTAKVAHDLGRRFIHCDVGINSIQIVRDRLKEAGASFQMLEIQDGVSLFRNPQQTMDKLATLIPSLQRDKKPVRSEPSKGSLRTD